MWYLSIYENNCNMNLQESIRIVLREESSIQVKLKNMINKFGIKTASKAVGGTSRLIKILDLDDKGLDELIYEHIKKELYPDFTVPDSSWSWGPEEYPAHNDYKNYVNKYGLHTFYVNGDHAYSYFGEWDGYDYLYLLSIDGWVVKGLTLLFDYKWIPTFKRWFEEISGLEVREINIEGKFLNGY